MFNVCLSGSGLLCPTWPPVTTVSQHVPALPSGKSEHEKHWGPVYPRKELFPGNESGWGIEHPEVKTAGLNLAWWPDRMRYTEV